LIGFGINIGVRLCLAIKLENTITNPDKFRDVFSGKIYKPSELAKS